jgi:hypothetical protein
MKAAILLAPKEPKKAEESILKMIEDGWLARPSGDKGKVTIGLRTFLELKQWLEETYSDAIVECVFCSEIVIRVISRKVFFS